MYYIYRYGFYMFGRPQRLLSLAIVKRRVDGLTILATLINKYILLKNVLHYCKYGFKGAKYSYATKT